MTVLALLASSGTALAGGYFYPDSGIVASGRGCAWVAGADTYFAQYYNPAALMNVERPQLALGATGVRQSVSFTRWEDPPPFEQDGAFVDPEPFFFDEVKNEGAIFTVPELGYAAPIGDKFAFAFGFTSGFAPDYVFPEDGPQRYAIIDNVIWNFQVGPSLAYEPIPQVAFGLGLQWQVLRVEEYLKVTTSGADDPLGDVSVAARVWDKFTPGFNAGVLVKPIPTVSIGVSVQPPLNYRGTGDGELDFTGHGLEPTLDQVVWKDDAIALELAMPMFLRTGVAVRPVEGLEIEGDFVYETWGRLDEILVTDIDVTVTGGNGFINEPVESTIGLPAGFQDVWSVRFGGEYRVSDLLEIRAGGFYESPSLSDENVSVALVDTAKTQTSVGASVFVGRFAIDGFAATTHYRSVEIRSSTVTQINVFDETKEGVVGNGDLRSRGVAIGFAGRTFFGKAPAPAGTP